GVAAFEGSAFARSPDDPVPSTLRRSPESWEARTRPAGPPGASIPKRARGPRTPMTRRPPRIHRLHISPRIIASSPARHLQPRPTHPARRLDPATPEGLNPLHPGRFREKPPSSHLLNRRGRRIARGEPAAGTGFDPITP